MFYNTEWQYNHGMAVKYHGKKFYNIGCQCFKTIFAVTVDEAKLVFVTGNNYPV